MAQQTTQQISNQNAPLVPNAQEWDNVLKQLEKVEILGNNVWRTASRVDEVQDNVEKIQKLVDIDDVQSAVQKEQNVIDTKVSVPSTLSSSEKKRYESIGQQFVKGAGKEFERIKKAIEMKQKMKTSKSQKVVEEIKKVDKKIKKDKTTSGGFWKKLLAVVVILGAVALIFQDKIAKLLPDLSGGMSGLGQKMKSAFSGLIQHMLTVCVDFIGGGLSGIITFVCTKIIPTTISGFFRDTLPMVMVASTLAVLSLFSEGAGAQLESLMGKRASQKTYNDESLGQSQIKEYNKQVDDANAKIEQFNNASQAQLMNQRRQFVTRNYNAQTTDENFKKIREELTRLENETGVQINNLIESGDVNLASMMQQIQLAQHISDTQARKKAVKTAIESHLGSLSQDQIKKVQDYVNTNVSDLIRISGLFVNHKQYKALDSQIKKAAEGRVGTSLTIDASSQPLPLSFVTQINVQGAILSSVADRIAAVMTSIDNFVNGKGQDGFIKKIQDFFTVVGNLCQKLVREYLHSIYTVLQYAEKVIYSDLGGKDLANRQSRVVYVTSQDDDKNNKNNQETKNIFVLNLHDHSSEKLNQFMVGIGNTQEKLVKNITSCNNTLGAINSLINEKIVVTGGSSGGSSGGKVDIESSLKPLATQVDANKKAINDILQKLNETPAETQQGTANPIKQS